MDLDLAGRGAAGAGLTLAWERRLARRGGQPLLDLPLFRDRAFSAGLAVNFGLVFFFGSFMFVLTLLLQAGLGQQPLHAGIEALPLATTFTVMSILSPRFAARLGPAGHHDRRQPHRGRHHRAGHHRRALRRRADRLGHRARHRADRARPGHLDAAADRHRADARQARAGRRGRRDPHHHPAVRRGQRHRRRRRHLLQRARRGPVPRHVRVRHGGGHGGGRHPGRAGGGRDAAAAAAGRPPGARSRPRRRPSRPGSRRPSWRFRST